MSFTVKDLIDDVRPLVNDADKTTWGDAIFFRYLNEGVLLIYSNYPECRVAAAGTLTDFAAIDALADTVPLDDIYRSAMVEYLAYRYHDADAGDSHDKSRTAEHLARFNELMGTAGK